MTPSEAYKAALEAAAKEIEDCAGFYGYLTLANRIRTLPVPHEKCPMCGGAGVYEMPGDLHNSRGIVPCRKCNGTGEALPGVGRC